MTQVQLSCKISFWSHVFIHLRYSIVELFFSIEAFNSAIRSALVKFFELARTI